MTFYSKDSFYALHLRFKFSSWNHIQYTSETMHWPHRQRMVVFIDLLNNVMSKLIYTDISKTFMHNSQELSWLCTFFFPYAFLCLFIILNSILNFFSHKLQFWLVPLHHVCELWTQCDQHVFMCSLPWWLYLQTVN